MPTSETVRSRRHRTPVFCRIAYLKVKVRIVEAHEPSLRSTASLKYDESSAGPCPQPSSSNANSAVDYCTGLVSDAFQGRIAVRHGLYFVWQVRAREIRPNVNASRKKASSPGADGIPISVRGISARETVGPNPFEDQPAENVQFRQVSANGENAPCIQPILIKSGKRCRQEQYRDRTKAKERVRFIVGAGLTIQPPHSTP